jgi:ribosomal protein L37AE/L43A
MLIERGMNFDPGEAIPFRCQSCAKLIIKRTFDQLNVCDQCSGELQVYGERQRDDRDEFFRRLFTWGKPPPKVLTIEDIQEVSSDFSEEEFEEIPKALVEQESVLRNYSEAYGIIYSNGQYPCPSCHAETLSFESVGHWD